MTASQKNSRAMAVTVNTFLDSNSTVWSAVPIINSTKTALTSVLDKIKEQDTAQNEAQVTMGVTKSGVKRTLSIKADILSDSLEALGEINENPELMSKANTSFSDFFRLGDDDFETEVEKLLELANTNETALADYGVSTAQIAELQDSLDSYRLLIGKPRTYRVASRQATETLDTLFDDLRTTLTRMDKLVKVFKRIEPVFYRGYEASRTIVG